MARMNEKVIRKIIEGREINTLIETGTADGRSAKIFAKVFSKVYTIELSPHLHAVAKENLKGYKNVNCIEGDSAEHVLKLGLSLKEPVVWYLDAHYCITPQVLGEAIKNQFPLWTEIETIILRKYPDIIVVDDVHSFGKSRLDLAESEDFWEKVTVDNIVKTIGQEKIDHYDVINDQFVVYMKNRLEEPGDIQK